MELYDKMFLMYRNCMIRSFGQPGKLNRENKDVKNLSTVQNNEKFDNPCWFEILREAARWCKLSNFTRNLQFRRTGSYEISYL